MADGQEDADFSDAICPICYKNLTRAFQTECQHLFCGFCQLVSTRRRLHSATLLEMRSRHTSTYHMPNLPHTYHHAEAFRTHRKCRGVQVKPVARTQNAERYTHHGRVYRLSLEEAMLTATRWSDIVLAYAFPGFS
eukprot:1192283-Prorocentrum_minimum.AAC.2